MSSTKDKVRGALGPAPSTPNYSILRSCLEVRRPADYCVAWPSTAIFRLMFLPCISRVQRLETGYGSTGA